MSIKGKKQGGSFSGIEKKSTVVLVRIKLVVKWELKWKAFVY